MIELSELSTPRESLELIAQIKSHPGYAAKPKSVRAKVDRIEATLRQLRDQDTPIIFQGDEYDAAARMVTRQD